MSANKRQPESMLWIHGWALGAFCFEPLLQLTKGSPTLYERGFFGEPKQVAGSAKTILTHSLGLHWLREEQIQNAEELIILSGFLHFHPEPARRSQKVVGRMLKQLEADPNALLQEFYKNLFAPQNTELHPPEATDTESLYKELTFLNESQISAERFAGIPKILILHGREDIIVPYQKAEELHQKLPQSELHILDGLGHGLFMTDPEKVWQIIQEWKERNRLTSGK